MYVNKKKSGMNQIWERKHGETHDQNDLYKNKNARGRSGRIRELKKRGSQWLENK